MRIWYFISRPAGYLHLNGEDGEDFLQSQFSNDIRRCDDEVGVYGLFLDRKAKILADAFVLRSDCGDGWGILSYHTEGSLIRSHLERHIIADDVEIEEDSLPPEMLTVGFDKCDGDGNLLNLYELMSKEGSPASSGKWWRARRDKHGAMETLVPRDETMESTLKKLTLDLGRRIGEEVTLVGLGREELEWLRIRDGIPAVPQDMGTARIPHDGNLESSAVSFHKGCFLGQEIVAKVEYSGQRALRWSLFRSVCRPGNLPALLYSGVKRVGEMTSFTTLAADGEGGIGVGFLRSRLVNGRESFSLEPGGEERVTIRHPGKGD